MTSDVKGYVVQWAVGARLRFDTFRDAKRVLGEAEKAGEQVSILRVHADGHEERLPDLEEALAEIERMRSIAPILLEGVPAIMRSSAPSSRKEIGAAACQRLKAIERALSVLQGSEPADPLAALEAAERRLLEAGGWTETPRGFWLDNRGDERTSAGVDWPKITALCIERERVTAAKKGGTQ